MRTTFEKIKIGDKCYYISTLGDMYDFPIYRKVTEFTTGGILYNSVYIDKENRIHPASMYDLSSIWLINEIQGS